MVVIRMFRAVPRRFGHAARPSRRRSFASELTGVMGLPVDAAPADVKRRYRALALETQRLRLEAIHEDNLAPLREQEAKLKEAMATNAATERALEEARKSRPSRSARWRR